ncbi:MAG TPA: CoA transferase [Methylomirabilota bacterium]|jgi:formyl-CoA transferase|nr:CoA transferase [Methylomirabilota bacterium]
MPVSPRALEGLRVLDRSQDLAGPFCGMLLADMGADVVKIEPPDGDPSRVMTPALAPGVSASFQAVNRNKRSLLVDLEQPDGVALMAKLAASADVIVESHRCGETEHPELRYDRLAATNPRLIGCVISPFGRTGPYAERAGDDLIAQAMSGIMSATGSEGGAPATIGVPITELGAGLFGVFGILCALRARHQTGRGQLVDASLLDAGLSLSAWEATEYWFTGQVPRGLGTAHRLNAPYQAFRASDGHFTVGAANNNLFPRFCALLGLEHLVKDARFDSVARRLANRAVLEPLIEAVTVHRPRGHWLARCEEAGVPAGPIYSVPEALDDAHARARGMVQTLPHPTLGAVRSLGNPVKMSATPPALTSAAPALGAHTDAVLREAGLGDADIAGLRARRVIA